MITVTRAIFVANDHLNLELGDWNTYKIFPPVMTDRSMRAKRFIPHAASQRSE